MQEVSQVFTFPGYGVNRHRIKGDINQPGTQGLQVKLEVGQPCHTKSWVEFSPVRTKAGLNSALPEQKLG